VQSPKHDENRQPQPRRANRHRLHHRP
jgi:hypothetical protein